MQATFWELIVRIRASWNSSFLQALQLGTKPVNMQDVTYSDSEFVLTNSSQLFELGNSFLWPFIFFIIILVVNLIAS